MNELSLYERAAARIDAAIASRTPAGPAVSEAMPRDEALRLAREALMPEQDPGMPYPIHALGPLSGAAERIAQGVQCDPALAGQSVLAAAALLAQGIANVRTLDGAVRPPSLNALTVASSGTARIAPTESRCVRSMNGSVRPRETTSTRYASKRKELATKAG
jgi:hypothetical protein